MDEPSEGLTAWESWSLGYSFRWGSGMGGVAYGHVARMVVARTGFGEVSAQGLVNFACLLSQL